MACELPMGSDWLTHPWATPVCIPTVSFKTDQVLHFTRCQRPRMKHCSKRMKTWNLRSLSWNVPWEVKVISTPCSSRVSRLRWRCSDISKISKNWLIRSKRRYVKKRRRYLLWTTRSLVLKVLRRLDFSHNMRKIMNRWKSSLRTFVRRWKERKMRLGVWSRNRLKSCLNVRKRVKQYVVMRANSKHVCRSWKRS